MTVSSTTSKSRYTGNGVTTAFTGSFPILDQTHVLVTLTDTSGVETTKTITTDYTVTGVGDSEHTVTFLSAPASGYTVTLSRNVPITQTLDLVPNDELPSTELEKSYDKSAMIDQQISEKLSRAITFPVSDSSSLTAQLTTASLRANKLAGFDSTGAVTVYDPSTLASTGAIFSDYLRSQFSGDGVTTAFTLPADPLTRDNTWVYIDGVYQTKTQYNISGVTLTFTSAPPAGTNNIEIMQGQGVTATAAPPTDNSVTTAKIVDSAVTTAKIADVNVTTAKIADGSVTLVKLGSDVPATSVIQSSKSVNYTLVLGDAGKHVFHPASDANSRTFTIPANASVAFPLGSVVTFINRSANSCTIAITTDTLTWSPAGTTGSRTLAQYGVATAIKINTTEWMISGTGLT